MQIAAVVEANGPDSHGRQICARMPSPAIPDLLCRSGGWILPQASGATVNQEFAFPPRFLCEAKRAFQQLSSCAMELFIAPASTGLFGHTTARSHKITQGID